MIRNFENELVPRGTFQRPLPLDSAADGTAEFRMVAADQMSPTLVDAWSSIRASNPALKSPYFDVEFTRMVARVRKDVQVAYTVRADRVESIFPFQQKNAQQNGPVGGMLNDVHGVIRSAETPTISDLQLIQRLSAKTGRDSFPFHAFHNGDADLSRFQFQSVDSYGLDLQQGWAAYQNWAQNNSSTLVRHGQKSRGLARDIGPVRLEFDVRDPLLLERLIELKRARYQRTKTFDILSVDWTANLLREIFHCRQPNFRGLLSALWAGDQLIAIHFGMQTDQILHYWFPVYDPSFARYSPGTELLLRITEAAHQGGVQIVDLGYGDDPYKFKFANCRQSLSCGEITSTPLAFKIARRKYFWRQGLKSMPLKPLAKNVLRKVFPGFGGWNFR